jgi:hypothetical protein
LSEVCVDTPVATFVGIGQSTARNPALDPHVVELALLGPQTRFDIAQALSVSQLGKRHAEVLIETREALDLVVSIVACHTTAKRGQRQMPGELRKHQLARVHLDLLRVSSSQGRKMKVPNSNRDQAKP